MRHSPVWLGYPRDRAPARIYSPEQVKAFKAMHAAAIAARKAKS